MARPVRVEYRGAVCHVMARGNHGQHIFRDDQDRKQWLETLGEACHKTGWRIHAYVLRGNHYHLLVETREGAPEKAALAWWLRQRTTVPLRWVSERLGMGHSSRVAQAVSRMRRRPGRKLEKLRRELAQAFNKEN
ncbi:MAG: transposase [Verrucomicrobiota bacterium]